MEYHIQIWSSIFSPYSFAFCLYFAPPVMIFVKLMRPTSIWHICYMKIWKNLVNFVRPYFNLIHNQNQNKPYSSLKISHASLMKNNRALSDSPRNGTKIHSHIESKYSEVSPPTWWFLGYGQFEGFLWRPLQLIGLDGYISGTSSPLALTLFSIIFNSTFW